MLLYVFDSQKLEPRADANPRQFESAAKVIKAEIGTTFKLLGPLISPTTTTNYSTTSSGSGSGVIIKYHHESSSKWIRLNTELDWRDAFNIAKLSNRKMYLSVSPSPPASSLPYNFNIDYDVAPEFFGNRYGEREVRGEAFYKMKEEGWAKKRRETQKYAARGGKAAASSSSETLGSEFGSVGNSSNNFKIENVSTTSSLLSTLLGTKPTRVVPNLKTVHKLEVRKTQRRANKGNRKGKLGEGDYTFSDELVKYNWDELCATGLEYR